MEAPAARIRRLASALSELSEQTSTLLEHSQIDGALEQLERSRPLVDEIARIALQPGVASTLDPRTQELARGLMDRQLRQVEQLGRLKREVAEELASLKTAQTRTQQFRVVYAGSRPPHSSTTLLG